MKRSQFILLCAASLTLLLLAAACSTKLTTGTTSDADVLLTAEAANPLPTQLANQGLSVVQTKACQVDKFVSVQTKAQQGDMLAWSPVGNSLAYVTPVNEKWGWFVGDLVIEDVASQKVVYTSQDLEVAGDVTWSPDGSQLAFVVLDPKVKVYTVDVLDLSSSKVQDAFGDSAATDQWSAPKGIDKWSDSHTLLMNASCDVDCSRVYTFDTQSGQLTSDATTDTRKAEDHSLNLVNQPSSLNSSWQIVSDNNDNVWMSSTVNHQASVILTGTTINEIKWSGDSSYLALRTDDSVLIYQPVCSK
jgi:hypothetical protein